MVDITAIGTAVTGLKAAYDIAVGLKDAAVEQEAKLKTSELLDAILSAQVSALQAHQAMHSLVEQVDSLKAEVLRLEAWDSEVPKYELADAGQGVVAYRLKATVEPGEPLHWLCPTCYGEKKKSLLQPETRFTRRTKWLVCNRCHTELLIKGFKEDGPQITMPAARRR